MSAIEIIICDDDFIHEDIKNSLESVRDTFFDFTVIKDFYGTHDLKKFLKSYEQLEDVDTILLLDNMFHGSPDGLQALKNIRKHCPYLPIIMLTTSDDKDRSFTIAKERYNIEFVQKPETASNLRFRIESIIQAMDRIKSDQNESVSEEIDKLSRKIEDLTNFVTNEMQKKIEADRNTFKTTPNFSEDENLISQFITQVSNYISNIAKQQGGLIDDQRNFLSERFGTRWSKLDETSRASLVSAAVIWKRCEDIIDDRFDYSGVCISVTSALEFELRKIFFKGFKSYIIKKYGKPNDETWQETFNTWPELLLNITKEKYEESISENKIVHLTLSDNFTLGTLPYLFGRRCEDISESQSNKICSLMNEYLASIVIENYTSNPVSAFYSDNKESFQNVVR